MPGKVETAEGSDVSECRGVYLLTHPRSASNMFQIMMAKQPGYQNSGYKFFDAGFMSVGQMHRGRLSEWPEDDRTAAFAAFQKGWENLQNEVADAQKNVSMLQEVEDAREVSFGSYKELIAHYKCNYPIPSWTDVLAYPGSCLLTVLHFRVNKRLSRNTLSSSWLQTSSSHLNSPTTMSKLLYFKNAMDPNQHTPILQVCQIASYFPCNLSSRSAIQR
jgi:hypothetical protein